MILFIANADTDLLGIRTLLDDLPEGFPPVRVWGGVDLGDELPDLDGVSCVLVRLHKGRSAWEQPFDTLRGACIDAGIPFLAFSGEAVPDAELTRLSTVPSATVSSAFAYLAHGGLANLEQFLRFVADTVLVSGFGFEPPAEVPNLGVWGDRAVEPGRPTVSIVFYRAHLLAGNTRHVEQLADALEAAGCNVRPVFCYSLRGVGDELLALLAGSDVVVTTTYAAGGTAAGGDAVTASRTGTEWTSPLDALGVPIVQAIVSTRSHDEWTASDAGLVPRDAATQVAIPEFDGRIIATVASHVEVVDDGDDLGAPISAYRGDPERVARVAGLAARLARLRSTPNAQKRVAVVLSAYPTKRSRIGNAVALDTPASVVDLLGALERAGYRLDHIPSTGDELAAELADGLTYDAEALTPAQLAAAPGHMAPGDYERWFGGLPADLRSSITEAWGPAPGTVHLHDDGALAFCGMDLGNVLVAVQPPRGFGENPIAVYHDPDLAPTHHYLGFYRWLATPVSEGGWGADAVVHAGKHGTLEWLPGKALALSASCAPDAAIADLPFVYPFVVNDPGEGTQAKRRAHAVVVDHLLPPMTRAETYDDLAQLEALLDEYAAIETLDPAKLPAIQGKVWDHVVSSELHRELGHTAELPDPDEFSALVGHIDGYLCELKDAQIRGGLHVLGRPPSGEALIDLVLAVTRLAHGEVPSLRATVGAELGIDPTETSTGLIDQLEAECRDRVERLAEAGWRVTAGETDPTLRWICERLVPDLARTTDEIDNLLGALAGRHVPAGPSGAPTRGQAHCLPTGRNFYSVDPAAIPSPLAWEVGVQLADGVARRHLAEEGRWPETVGLVVWGTAAMRTQGDDVAQALALLGVRPTWAPESGRVTGLEVIPPAELGRPRIDVTVRISGFFRDAFSGLVELIDDAVALVRELDEPLEQNPIRARGGDDARVFGPGPGSYGSGLLPAIENRNWRSDEDLAQIYLTWSGWSYRRGAMGVADAEGMRRRFAAIDVAVKNQDNREHDIFDSDDYFQDHGGMVAAVRHLRGSAPLAYFGDSSDPARPRVRSLAEEAARVVRTRVINPRWIEAMQRHGYKGAFEMAATVDYLFGYDATAGVVEDWMYERVTQAYVADPAVRKFFEASNPWALKALAERLLEAARTDGGAAARPIFPFAAVVGMDDLKHALQLAAIDPAIGGVLLRGQKGAAKSTLARAMAELVGEGAPFAELPLGATEDRLVGSLDLAAALSGGGRRFEPGVLAAAHGGVLYVDEVNLLADHLVDVLLDVAVSGVNRVEREGISHAHPARFVLVGSMNPEEGELRPQLLDRFGLAVEVLAPVDPELRAEAVRRRLAFDRDPTGFRAGWAAEQAALAERLASTRPATLADELYTFISRLCVELGAEGLRADLVLARAAAAHAGWDGRAEATTDDVVAVAPLVLGHRRRRDPFEDPGLDQDDLDRALENAQEPPPPPPPTDDTADDIADDSDADAGPPDREPPESPGGRSPEAAAPPSRTAAAGAPLDLGPLHGGRGRPGPQGRRAEATGPTGRLVRDRVPDGAPSSLAVRATGTAAAVRRAADPGGPDVDPADVREAVRTQRVGTLLVLCVDASGSMNAPQRMEAVKGAVLGLLLDAYQRRDRVALVTFGGDGAQVLLRPTGSVEVARRRLDALASGGATPLGAGIDEARRLALANRTDLTPLLVVLSDGRATAAPDGVDPDDAARRAATQVRRDGLDAVVIDAETGPVPLGRAETLAGWMAARHVHLPALEADTLRSGLTDLLR